MKIIAYTYANLSTIGLNQGKTYSAVKKILEKMQSLDPDNTYYAMSDFEPTEENPTQVITYLDRSALLFAFKDLLPSVDLELRDLNQWTHIQRKSKKEMGLDGRA